jgi:hypothetical protein
MEPGQVALLAAQTQSELAEAAKKRGEGGAAGVLDAGQRVLDTVALIRGDVKDKEGKTVKVGDFKTLANVAGPIRSKFPTTSQESADTENAIKTLNDQVFLQQIKNMKGMGALSEKEGDRLAASVASLSLTQSPERLQKNIQYIEETTRKAMEKMQSMGGGSTGAAAPAAGVFDAADAILRGGK